MNKKVDPSTLIDFLLFLDDPRIDRTKKHSLIDILIIAVSATICGAKTWVDIEDFGNSKIDWFKSFLNLKHGIPSHDTFRRLFLILDPKKFLEIFMAWIETMGKDEDLKQICVDGKALRATFEKGKKHSAIHMLNAWSTGLSLSIGQLKTDGKSNEIKTVPKLLDLLSIKGCIVSVDALNCQVEIAKKIREKEADYLLALKGNQEYLEQGVKARFEELSKPGPKKFHVEKHEEEVTGHGRIESRKYRVITQKEGGNLGVNPFERWPDLNSLIEVQSLRVNKKTGEFSEETRYYISSAIIEAKEFSKSIRAHWEVENKLHWVLDVVFREDDCRNKAGHSAENFSLLRHFALNLIKLEPSKKAIRRKQNIAGWDESFLVQILL
jgi:predicted transposase YbfD/YdcC